MGHYNTRRFLDAYVTEARKGLDGKYISEKWSPNAGTRYTLFVPFPSDFDEESWRKIVKRQLQKASLIDQRGKPIEISADRSSEDHYILQVAGDLSLIGIALTATLKRGKVAALAAPGHLHSMPASASDPIYDQFVQLG